MSSLLQYTISYARRRLMKNHPRRVPAIDALATERGKSVIALVDRLITLTESIPEARRIALQLREQIEIPIPMEAILALIPGMTHEERRERVGVSRQAYY